VIRLCNFKQFNRGDNAIVDNLAPTARFSFSQGWAGGKGNFNYLGKYQYVKKIINFIVQFGC
jgi:hypothetical protein